MIRVKYYRPNANVYDLRYFKDDEELEDWIKRNTLPPYNEDIKIVDKHYFKLKEPPKNLYGMNWDEHYNWVLVCEYLRYLGYID